MLALFHIHVFHVYFIFYCVGKIILRTWNGEKKRNGEKNVVRTYIKQEPESCSSVKNYPSVKTEMVFSDYTKRRILVLRRPGNYPPTISRLPRSDGIRASWRGI